jgi:hypothetical protein
VIKILVSQIVYIRRLNSTTIALWTFNAGHFPIKTESEKLIQLRSIIQTIAETTISELPPSGVLAQIPDLNQAFDKWNSHSLSSDQLLLVINGLRGRTFADIKQFPCLTPRFNRENPVAAKGDETTLCAGGENCPI